MQHTALASLAEDPQDHTRKDQESKQGEVHQRQHAVESLPLPIKWASSDLGRKPFCQVGTGSRGHFLGLTDSRPFSLREKQAGRSCKAGTDQRELTLLIPAGKQAEVTGWGLEVLGLEIFSLKSQKHLCQEGQDMGLT